MSLWRQALSCLCVSLTSIFALAQVRGLEEIDVDLGSAMPSGTKGLPFDVPFIMTGNVDASLRKISLSYKVSDADSKKRWLEFKGSESPAIWLYTPEQKKWHLKVGPLHPNITYEFTFHIIRSHNTAINDVFKNNAFNIIERLYSNPATIDPAAIARATKDLHMLLQNIVGPGKTIVDANEDEFTIDLNIPPFSKMTNEVRNNAGIDFVGTIDSINITNIFLHPDFQAFKDRLTAVLTTPDILSPASAKLWNESVDLNNQTFTNIKVQEMAQLVQAPSNHILEVIYGHETITNNTSFTTVSAPNMPSIDLVLAFFQKLRSNLTDTHDNRIFTSAEINIPRQVISILTEIRALHNLNKTRKERRDAIIAQFPNILADKLIATTATMYDVSAADIASASTPYIGLDFGLSYIPGYSQLFLYEGVNIYLVPVNKNAPLSTFKNKWNNFLKRFSIHFGLTHDLIKVENPRYQKLIANIGSLMLGAGIRLNRAMRINAGYMFFYEKDNNPLLEKKHFTAMPQISLTFDINIAKAFGSIGKRLNVPQ